MTWNPIEAEAMLSISGVVNATRSVKKLAGFEFRSKRELALLLENASKVTVYSSIAPNNMPDVVVEELYQPSKTRSGRHADIESVARSLGYAYSAYRLHVKSRAGMALLLGWLQYA